MPGEHIHDLIIVGAGPAGITAAVYAARKRLDMLIVSPDIGGQTAWSGDIENYTGYQLVTGPDLVAKFEEHMKAYGVPMREEEAVAVTREGDAIAVKTASGMYRARAAIVASGKRSRELGVPGEKEFRNKGLTYCATCDAPLFSGKDVAVVGGGNSGLDAVLQLVKIARRIFLVNISERPTGDPIMQEKVTKSPVVTVMNRTKVLDISGGAFVERMRVEGPGGMQSLPVQGVFVEIGLIPNSRCVPDVRKNAQGEIIVDNQNRTSVPGIFAAGDVTDVPEKQIIIAAGEGAKAVLSAFRHINVHP